MNRCAPCARAKSRHAENACRLAWISAKIGQQHDFLRGHDIGRAFAGLMDIKHHGAGVTQSRRDRDRNSQAYLGNTARTIGIGRSPLAEHLHRQLEPAFDIFHLKPPALVTHEPVERNALTRHPAAVEIECALEVQRRLTQEIGQAAEREEPVQGCPQHDISLGILRNETAVGQRVRRPGPAVAVRSDQHRIGYHGVVGAGERRAPVPGGEVLHASGRSGSDECAVGGIVIRWSRSNAVAEQRCDGCPVAREVAAVDDERRAEQFHPALQILVSRKAGSSRRTETGRDRSWRARYDRPQVRRPAPEVR